MVLTLPHRAFHRRIGVFADVHVSPDGRIVTADEWARQAHQWLPMQEDHAFVASLMQPATAPGKMASWIAPPSRGIHGKPVEYEYVRFH